MRNRAGVVVLLAGALGACGPGTESPRDVDRAAVVAEVNETVEALLGAMNSHDTEQVLSFYSQDDDFVYVGCTSTRRGFEPNAEIIRRFNSSQDAVTFDMRILSTRVLGPSSAVVTLSGSTTDAEALMWTYVFTKSEGGDWLLAHEHESWPDCAAPGESHPMTGGP